MTNAATPTGEQSEERAAAEVAAPHGDGVSAVSVMAPAAATATAAPSDIAGRTPWQLVRARLRRDRTTLFMLGVCVLTLLLALVAPFLVRWGVLDPYTFNNDLIDVNKGGVKGAWGGMSTAHPLGVEPGTGRDVLSRVVLGVTFSILIAFAAMVVAVAIGTVVGLVSGYLGGATDGVLSKVMELVLTFPQTLMLLALSGPAVELIRETLGAKDTSNVPPGIYIAGVLGLFGWPTFARIIRGQVLSLREREFVEAARSLGARTPRILFRELLPNLWAPVLVYATLLMPTFISAEAALSFLGVGIRNPTPTLGNVLASSTQWASAVPTYFFFPAIIIATLVLSFNLLGDGLRDALDPKAGR